MLRLVKVVIKLFIVGYIIGDKEESDFEIIIIIAITRQ